MKRTHLARLIVAGTTAVILAACSSLPLPMNVDLKAKIPDTSSEGTVTEPVRKG